MDKFLVVPTKKENSHATDLLSMLLEVNDQNQLVVDNNNRWMTKNYIYVIRFLQFLYTKFLSICAYIPIA